MTSDMELPKTQSPKSIRTIERRNASIGGLGCWIGGLILAASMITPVHAQSSVRPSEPLRLNPPQAIPPSVPVGQWNQLPRDGLVMDPGAFEAFDAADPASPFRTQAGQVSRFGNKITAGLPDKDPIETQSLKSELVSGPGLELGEESLDEPGGDDDRIQQRRVTKQRLEQRRRLEEAFPKDYLLDSSDPGLFQFLDQEWIPVRRDEEVSTLSKIQRESYTAWQELRPQLLTKLQSCDRLLRNNSMHSARDEIRNGLTLLTRRIDQITGASRNPSPQKAIRRSMPHESTLQHALRELDESGYASPSDVAQSLQSFSDLIPQATLNHPWAADLLYALGKTYERELAFSPEQSGVLRAQAVACYGAALRMAPTRGYIANQLGYNHLHAGSLDDASKALQQALDAGPTPYSWRNLAELYRRRGAIREAKLADEQAEYLMTKSQSKP